MPMKRISKKKDDRFGQVRAAVAFIRRKVSNNPGIGIILGTGLGNLARRIEKPVEVPYKKIPYFPQTTAESHAGNLCFGILGGKEVVAMEGRFHYYEGYSLAEVTFPVRVLRELGVHTLIVSNAAGGLNLGYQKGELVLIADHINGMGVNPLIGPNEDRWGPRFPDMSCPYSPELIRIASQTAARLKIPVKQGVYYGVTGPCLETRAEYRMMRQLGADLVGMSTVPEVIVGAQMDMKILGVSVVTDRCDPDHLEKVDIQEIIRTANQAGPKLDRLILETVKDLPGVSE
ncbi:MAG: purine-nucleoside phosphorylase [Candidatus Omnitrophota bacterium]